MRTLVADGNFKQDHLKMKNDNDDVPLNDGLRYMVGRKDFKTYMDSVPPSSKSQKVANFPCDRSANSDPAFRHRPHLPAMNTAR